MSSPTTITPFSTESNSKISGAKYGEIIGNIILKIRLGKGWSPNSPQDQQTSVAVWLEILTAANIPGEHLSALYKRANETIQIALANGKEPPEMSANLLAAAWIGYRHELEEKRIDDKRYLPATAASVCPRCDGSGWERKKDGFYNGVIRCDHIVPFIEETEESEPIF